MADLLSSLEHIMEYGNRTLLGHDIVQKYLLCGV